MKFLEKLKYKESKIHWYLKSVWDLGVISACIIYITFFKFMLPNDYFITLTLQDYVIFYTQVIILFILITYFGFKLIYNLALNYKDFFKSLAINLLFIVGLYSLHSFIDSHDLLINLVAFILYIIVLIKSRTILLVSMHLSLIIPTVFLVISTNFLGTSSHNTDKCTYSHINELDKMKDLRFDESYLSAFNIRVISYTKLTYPKMKECYIKYGHSENVHLFFKSVDYIDEFYKNILEFGNAEYKRYSSKDYYKDRKTQLNGFANALAEIESTKFYNNYDEKWKAYNYATYDFLLTYIERVEDAYYYKHITQTYRKERLHFAKDYLNTVFAKDSKFREDKFVNENIEKLEEFLDNI